MDGERRNEDLRILHRIRRSALRSVKDGDERARFIVRAVDELIRERDDEPVNTDRKGDTIDR
jgi:hypothetical protein